jgi:multidrug efflux pump
MVPLLIASGPGAASRFAMGVVIASGMTLGTLFTLFVLPAFYLYLARDHGGSGAPVPAPGGHAPELGRAQPA